jgi:hypothetical protein
VLGSCLNIVYFTRVRDEWSGELTLESFLYFFPALTYSVVLGFGTVLYLLYFALQCRRHRKFALPSSDAVKTYTQPLPKTFLIALLILLSHILYRYADAFSLGLELTILIVSRRAGTANGRAPYHLCTLYGHYVHWRGVTLGYLRCRYSGR